MKFPVVAGAVIVGMLLLALLPLPYGYYQLLRLVVCAASLWLAINLGSETRMALAIAFGFLALLYNPIFPIHFGRSAWSFINVLTAPPFAWAAYRGWHRPAQ